MTSDKGKVARQQQVGRQIGVNSLEQNLHTSGKFCVQSTVPDEISTAMFINIHWIEISLQRSFPFLPEIFFVKDCIEEIRRFVAAVK